MYKTINANSFENNNNTVPSISMTWHQKEPLVVLYTHIAQETTNASSVYIATYVIIVNLVAYYRE